MAGACVEAGKVENPPIFEGADSVDAKHRSHSSVRQRMTSPCSKSFLLTVLSLLWDPKISLRSLRRRMYMQIMSWREFFKRSWKRTTIELLSQVRPTRQSSAEFTHNPRMSWHDLQEGTRKKTPQVMGGALSETKAWPGKKKKKRKKPGYWTNVLCADEQVLRKPKTAFEQRKHILSLKHSDVNGWGLIYCDRAKSTPMHKIQYESCTLLEGS